MALGITNAGKLKKANEYFDKGDYAKAFSIYEKLDHTFDLKKEIYNEVRFKLGRMYEDGLGVAVDKEKAAKYYDCAKDYGNGEACARHALLYFHGHIKGRQNWGEAFRLAREAVENGFTKAKDIWEQFDVERTDEEWEQVLDSVAEYLENFTPLESDSCYPTNYEEFKFAIVNAWLGAQKGIPRAQCLVGEFFARGLGVWSNYIKNYREADYWYDKAIEQGYLEARFCQVQHYEVQCVILMEFGLDSVESIIFDYQTLAEQGHAKAKECMEPLKKLFDAGVLLASVEEKRNPTAIEEGSKNLQRVELEYIDTLKKRGILYKYSSPESIKEVEEYLQEGGRITGW